MKEYIHEIPAHGKQEIVEKEYDVIVVGGGMSGVCAAIASARHGAKTALIQTRSVYGGNASSEVRMHIGGASCHWGKENAVETGILLELQLCNQYLNYTHNYSIWDSVLLSAVKETEGLDGYLNTTMDEVVSDGTKIEAVKCYQMTTEQRYEMRGSVFIDATGNGTLGYFAGAEYRFGSEDRNEFHEKSAREENSGDTMGSTIMFCAQDTGHPVHFVRPRWARKFDESDLQYRYHGNITVYHDADKIVELKPEEDYEDHRDQLVEKYDSSSGYWWIELGGDWKDIIRQAEDISYELQRCVYGVWDHIKNGGEHGAENYELIWVGNHPGIREGRRIEGTYMLTENDILENRVFEDAVAYGGWPMDEHTAGGIDAKGEIPSRVMSFEGLYTIPYGCYCSKTINNMMMAGRIIGASKMAMSSTRLMGTCSVGGQAVGTAAALAVKYKCSPHEVGRKHIKELQQNLLKDDCYIPGFKNEDPNDLARNAKISASSWIEGSEPENVINGISRNVGKKSNQWCSAGMSSLGEWIEVDLGTERSINQIRLTFDPDLSQEHCISLSKAFIDKIPVGVPKELVKEYEIIFYLDKKEVFRKAVKGNYQRLNIINLETRVHADRIRISVTETNGLQEVRIFEIRIY